MVYKTEVCLIYGTCLYKKVRQQAERVLNYTSELVTGIEPATFGTEIRRSNHCEAFLSYGTHSLLIRWDATDASGLLEYSNGGNQEPKSCTFPVYQTK